jgi:hypothetical protein
VEFAIVAAVLAGLSGTAFAFVRFSGSGDARRTRRVLRKARVVPIAELVDGQLACVVGRVEVDGELVESLIERRACVAFDATTTTFEGNEMTMDVKITRRVVPFYVSDNTGRVRIDAPEIALCNRPVARSERYEERILEDGVMIRIVGSVALEPAMQGSCDHLFRHGAFKARLTGTARYPLLADVERG